MIGEYRLSNRLRHSILAVLSVLIVAVLGLMAFSLRSSEPAEDSVRAGVSIPDPTTRRAGAFQPDRDGGQSLFTEVVVPPASTTVSAADAARRATPAPEPEPEPSSTTAAPDPEPDPEPSVPTSPTTTTPPSSPPDPEPTVTWITLPDPTFTFPLPTIDPTLPSTFETITITITWETTIPSSVPSTGDITRPTLPPEPEPDHSR